MSSSPTWLLALVLITTAAVVAEVPAAASSDHQPPTSEEKATTAAAPLGTPPRLLLQSSSSKDDDHAALLPIDERFPATIRRQRLVHLDRDALIASAMRAGSRVQFNMFDDATLLAEITHVEARSLSSFTATGRLLDNTLHNNNRNNNAPDISGGWFVLAVEDDTVVANIWTATGEAYQIRPADDAGYRVQQLDVSAFAPCSCDEIHQAHQPGNAIAARDNHDNNVTGGIGDPIDPCNRVIDVLVAYTREARQVAGGEGAIRAIAHASIASSNIALSNSAVDARFRLVHLHEVDYTEDPFILTNLVYLTSQGDGHMDEIHHLRDQYGADLVSLLVGGFFGSCGMAHVMINPSPASQAQAFSVVNQSCAVGNLTFAHELAHNLGCQHESNGFNSGAFPYSFGHRFTGQSGRQWRTVMANSPGSRIAHYSNPNIIFDGVPTGLTADEGTPADNARTINELTTLVSSFRSAVPADCNGNGIPDACELHDGTSSDVNENGIPDECDGPECASVLTDVLAASELESFIGFGNAVAMSDTRAVIGAAITPSVGDNAGAVYVYRLDGSAWTLEATLVGDDVEPHDRFGQSVAIADDDSFILVGAHRHEGAVSDVGAVYVFRRENQTWIQEAKLSTPDAEQADQLGWSVAFAIDSHGVPYAAAGALFRNTAATNAGSVLVFRRTQPGQWVLEAELTAPDAASGDQFGYAIDAYEDRVIIAARAADSVAVNAGAAYIFVRSDTGWVQEAKLVASDGSEGDLFGTSVALTSDWAIVGSPRNNEISLRAGAAYAFRRSGSSWVQNIKLVAADGAAYDAFGTAVDARSSRVIIGSPLAAHRNSACGVAYIFDFADDKWVQHARIAPSDGAPQDNFGISVALAPNQILAAASAPLDDHAGFVDAGTVRTFSIPAIHQPDCNGNGIPDACEIDAGLAADHNNNGIPDSCETACPADIAGNDGAVNVDDLLAVIANWGSCSPSCPLAPCAGDIDGNCVVDHADLITIISNWGECE